MLYRNLLRIFLFGLLFTYLSACQSPRERFQTEIQDVLNQIPTPDGVDLVCLEYLERLAKQGIGTSFGVAATYGTDLRYDDIAEQYRVHLSEQGWRKYGRTTWEEPVYCNPQYKGIVIEIFMSSGSIQCENSSSNAAVNSNFQTFYIVTVRKFPYDSIGEYQEDNS